MTKPSSAKTRRRNNRKVRRTQSRRGGSYLNAFKVPYNASSKERGFFSPSSSSSRMEYTPSSPLAIALKRIEKAARHDIIESESKLRENRITLEEHDTNVVRITQLAEEEKRAARKKANQPTWGDTIHGVRTSAANLRTRAANLGTSALEGIKNSEAAYVASRFLDWPHTADGKGLLDDRGI